MCPICGRHNAPHCQRAQQVFTAKYQSPLKNLGLDAKFDSLCKVASASDVIDLLNEFRNDQASISEIDAFTQQITPLFSNLARREKSLASLKLKVAGRFENKKLTEIDDIYGLRVKVRSLEDICFVVSQLNFGKPPIEGVSETITSPTSLGYRAVHLLFRLQTGKLLEFQIMTPLQARFAAFTHDRIYKNPPEQISKKRLKKYFSAVSDYLDRYQRGFVDDLPEAGDDIKNAGLEFPFDEIKSEQSK